MGWIAATKDRQRRPNSRDSIGEQWSSQSEGPAMKERPSLHSPGGAPPMMCSGHGDFLRWDQATCAPCWSWAAHTGRQSMTISGVIEIEIARSAAVAGAPWQAVAQSRELLQAREADGERATRMQKGQGSAAERVESVRIVAGASNCYGAVWERGSAEDALGGAPAVLNPWDRRLCDPRSAQATTTSPWPDGSVAAWRRRRHGGAEAWRRVGVAASRRRGTAWLRGCVVAQPRIAAQAGRCMTRQARARPKRGSHAERRGGRAPLV